MFYRERVSIKGTLTLGTLTVNARDPLIHKNSADRISERSIMKPYPQVHTECKNAKIKINNRVYIRDDTFILRTSARQ